MNTNAYGFLMKIVLFSYDAGIAIPLSIRYDECRRPKTGHPQRRIGDSLKKLTARRASERP